MAELKLPPAARAILTGMAVIAGVVIYAYGVKVTQVDLEQTQKPDRLLQLTRIMRAIAHPDLIQYEQTEKTVAVPIHLPCPAGGVTALSPDASGPYIAVTPPCAGEREEITVEGFNFQPDIEGPIEFLPPSGVHLQLGSVKTDGAGHFTTKVTLPRRPSPDAQTIQVTLRTNGAMHLSQSAKDTWDKIIETVFLALLATTIGIAIAIPVSFLAAHNIMRPVTSPLVSMSVTLLALPLGMYLGAVAARQLGGWGLSLGANHWMGLGALAVSPLVVWGAARWALPQEEIEPPKTLLRVARGVVLLGCAAVVAIGLGLLAALGKSLGNDLTPRLGPFGFLSFFLFSVSNALGLLLPLLGALAGGFTLVSLAGSAGEYARLRMGLTIQKVIAVPLAGLAGATYFALVGAGIAWLYQLNDAVRYFWIPAAIGGAIGLGWASLAKPDQPVQIGLFVYTLTRTILNALRAIEPLIMVIVFAVWVGIGPFAGTLALALHTIAALGKLYSEQVESILTGPLEAVQATGATKLQTIVYAVIPQIVPPYISFTMYRWDINVRMSTIIGFAGGGGIGFLLQQNITLLQYRAASVQMLAIAIVVATMDFVSAKLREKVI